MSEFPTNFINCIVLNAYMAETITIKKQAIKDLVKVKSEFDSIVESLELMSEEDFMDSYRKSKEQIKKREFVDLDGL